MTTLNYESDRLIEAMKNRVTLLSDFFVIRWNNIGNNISPICGLSPKLSLESEFWGLEYFLNRCVFLGQDVVKFERQIPITTVEKKIRVFRV